MDSVHHQEEAVHTVALDRLYVNVNQDLQDRDVNRKVNLQNKHKESFLVNNFILICDILDPCVPNPCGNNGQCVPQGTSYMCQCNQGYSGQK